MKCGIEEKRVRQPRRTSWQVSQRRAGERAAVLLPGPKTRTWGTQPEENQQMNSLPRRCENGVGS